MRHIANGGNLFNDFLSKRRSVGEQPQPGIRSLVIDFFADVKDSLVQKRFVYFKWRNGER